MPELLCRAELVDKLQAVCHRCGGPATMTQRLVNGYPAPADGATIVVGALDSYEARCRSCHEIAEPASRDRLVSARRIVSVSPVERDRAAERGDEPHRDGRAEVAQILAEHDLRRRGRDGRDVDLAAADDDARPPRGRRAGAPTGRAPRRRGRPPRRRSRRRALAGDRARGPRRAARAPRGRARACPPRGAPARSGPTRSARRARARRAARPSAPTPRRSSRMYRSVGGSSSIVRSSVFTNPCTVASGVRTSWQASETSLAKGRIGRHGL